MASSGEVPQEDKNNREKQNTLKERNLFIKVGIDAI